MPIMDQGYQHWTGRLAGHRWRWLAVARQGIRVSMRTRYVRYVLFAAWAPALTLSCLLAMWGLLERKSSLVSTFVSFMAFMNPGVVAAPLHYRVDVWRLAYGYFMHVELYFSMVVILLIGPNLISQDLRVNALPLYFSRPLRRSDYFLGKLGVIVFFLAMVMIAPAIVAYILGLLFSLDITIIPQTIGILLAAIVYGAVIALCAGTLMLALSALTRNSRYVALLWLGVWFIGGIGSGVLEHVHQHQLRFDARQWMLKHQVPVRRFLPLIPNSERPPLDQNGWQLYRQRYAALRLADATRDWRPLASYTGDLARIGQQLLQTNEAWRSIGKLLPPGPHRQRLLARYLGPRYPWYWAVGVLACVLGICIWILHRSIRAMDRLK